MPKRQKPPRANGETVKGIAAQLVALSSMSVAELREKYEEVFGVPTRTRNRDWLRKKIAWRIQELAEGGLSERAEARVAALERDAPARHIRPPTTPSAAKSDEALRDPRLPPVGTVLTRTYKGVEHRVTVLADGFEFRGSTYASLSKVALEITGTVWNGHLFFGLKKRGKGGGER